MGELAGKRLHLFLQRFDVGGKGRVHLKLAGPEKPVQLEDLNLRLAPFAVELFPARGEGLEKDGPPGSSLRSGPGRRRGGCGRSALQFSSIYSRILESPGATLKASPTRPAALMLAAVAPNQARRLKCAFPLAAIAAALALGLFNASPQASAQSSTADIRARADRGEADAQFDLGVMCFDGRGVPQDDAEAVRWYRRAAEQGDAYAQHNLGVMYANGQGVPQDYVEAHKWVNLAASQNIEGFDRKRAAAMRSSLATRMTSAQIAEAQRLAREWRPKTPP